MIKRIEEIREWLNQAADFAFDTIARTGPVHADRAEEAVRLAYREAKLPPPRTFVWAPSPDNTLPAGRKASFHWDDAHLRIAEIWALPRARAWAAIEKALKIHATDFALMSHAGKSHTLRAALLQRESTIQRCCGYGNHDATWLAQLNLLREHTGLRAIPVLEGLNLLCQFGCWFRPYSKACLMFERPSQILTDPEGRLHSLSSPALSWGSSLKAYCLHGVKVPEIAILDPSSISARWINEQSNVEVRRVLIHEYGWERYLAELNGRQVHRDPFGTLYRIPRRMDQSDLVVQVINSTPEPDGTRKKYFLFVPPEVTTAKEAVAWTFGKSAEEFDLVAQS